MYIYSYVYIYIYMYIFICIYIHMYIYIYTYEYTYIHIIFIFMLILIMTTQNIAPTPRTKKLPKSLEYGLSLFRGKLQKSLEAHVVVVFGVVNNIHIHVHVHIHKKGHVVRSTSKVHANSNMNMLMSIINYGVVSRARSSELWPRDR